MSRPLSRRVAVVAAVLGAAAAVSACTGAQAGADPLGPQPAGADPLGPQPAGTHPVDGGPGARAGSAPTPAEVERTKRALDERAGRAPSSVTSWGVDPAVGLVVVRVTGGRTPEVERFLSGLDPRTLRVVTGSDPVRPLPGTS